MTAFASCVLWSVRHRSAPDEERLVQGQVQGERRLLLLFGTAKLGSPDDAVRAVIDSIVDLADLDRLAQRLLTVSSWEELMAGWQ